MKNVYCWFDKRKLKTHVSFIFNFILHVFVQSKLVDQ